MATLIETGTSVHYKGRKILVSISTASLRMCFTLKSFAGKLGHVSIEMTFQGEKKKYFWNVVARSDPISRIIGDVSRYSSNFSLSSVRVSNKRRLALPPSNKEQPFRNPVPLRDPFVSLYPSFVE